MKQSVTTFGNPVLRKKAVKIETVTQEIKDLAASMLETMHAHRGLGLAAEQVGRTEAICVVDVPPDCQGEEFVKLNAPVKMPLILLNPVVSMFEGTLRCKEGCLSFPGLFIDVTRARSCTVAYMGIDGRHYEARVHGMLARAVQHEVDHLNGVLLVDKMSPTQKTLNAGKLRRIRRGTLEGPNQQAGA
ncbi:MAG: peptide deformylase [Kiritimatiellia bacterium]